MNETIQRYDTSKKKSRILIVDEHSIIHWALTELIGQDPGLEFCAKAENAKQLWEIIDKQQVDLAIVDISLKGMNGLQIVEEIKLKCPNLPILIFSMHDEALHAKRASRARTKEYVVDKKAVEQIIEALRHVQSLLRSRIFGFTVLSRLKGV